MIWIRNKFPHNGKPVPVLAPMSTVASATITKTGVLFFRPNGEVGFWYPNSNICEFIQDDKKYTQVTKTVPCENLPDFEYTTWVVSKPLRDSTGRVIG